MEYGLCVICMKTITENRLSKRYMGRINPIYAKMIMKMYESSKTAKVLISQYPVNDAYRKKFYDLCETKYLD